MAPSPICHSTASLAIDMAPSDKEGLGNALSNAKAIEMDPSDKNVLGNALSNANISKKPSSPSFSANIDGMSSDKEVSSDEEEQLLLTQPDAVDLMVEEEDKQCLLIQPNAGDGTTEVINKRGSS
jgi:hypothetical protein